MRTYRMRLDMRRALTALAAVAFVASQGPAAIGQAKGDGNLGHVLKKTVLVFPFDVADSMAPNALELSELLTDATVSRLIASKAYSVTTFYKAWAPVARLHADQQVNDADLVAPFADDNRKALKIGGLVAYDAVCIGSVDDYQYNETDRQVTVTVSGRLIEVETGKVVKSVTLSADGPKGAANAMEEEVNLPAVRAASEKLLVQLVPAGIAVVQDPVVATPVTKKKRGGNEWVWLLVLGVGLGIGLSGSGGSGGGIENPPPPP